ncbi:MAG: reverse transcriptase domain-containing protein, partial [Hyphomicrobium sp.]
MRQISAPRGLTRDLQYKVLPILQQVFDAHPGAHGFIKSRSVVSNASGHTGQRLVLNIDLKDFFPSINFGRVRGLFMSKAFGMGPSAAAIFAQICTFKNGLPQGAPTSPVLSNFMATNLDRQLSRLARQNRMHYSRYADDITFSTSAQAFPASIAVFEAKEIGKAEVKIGETLENIIKANGFSINAKKVRLQRHFEHQSVTGLCVNAKVNVERQRIRQVRAMIHAWQKFGLDDAATEHFRHYASAPKGAAGFNRAASFRNAVYGQLAFIKMVRGPGDPVFLNLCAKLLGLDPNPSKFIRKMVFGADDYDIFISHASEDREAVARPIHAACEALGLKAFLDEEHIGWGENFTKKINSALGAARTVLTIISPVSVTKDWPMAEVNTALTFEVS